MVVVTGATGHIGNVLVRELLSRGENVSVVIPPFEDTACLDGLQLEMVKGDVRQIDSLIQAFRGGDVVYHLAGVISILPGKNELLHQVNVVGTRNVVEACLKTDVRRLIYTSSIHAVKEPPHGTVIDETLPYGPDTVLGDYAKSKARATLEVLKGVKRGLDIPESHVYQRDALQRDTASSPAGAVSVQPVPDPLAVDGVLANNYRFQ